MDSNTGKLNKQIKMVNFKNKNGLTVKQFNQIRIKITNKINYNLKKINYKESLIKMDNFKEVISVIIISYKLILNNKTKLNSLIQRNKTKSNSLIQRKKVISNSLILKNKAMLKVQKLKFNKTIVE